MKAKRRKEKIEKIEKIFTIISIIETIALVATVVMVVNLRNENADFRRLLDSVVTDATMEDEVGIKVLEGGEILPPDGCRFVSGEVSYVIENHFDNSKAHGGETPDPEHIGYFLRLYQGGNQIALLKLKGEGLLGTADRPFVDYLVAKGSLREDGTGDYFVYSEFAGPAGHRTSKFEYALEYASPEAVARAMAKTQAATTV